MTARSDGSLEHRQLLVPGASVVHYRKHDGNSLHGQTERSTTDRPEIRALANGRNRPVPFA